MRKHKRWQRPPGATFTLPRQGTSSFPVRVFSLTSILRCSDGEDHIAWIHGRGVGLAARHHHTPKRSGTRAYIVDMKDHHACLARNHESMAVLISCESCQVILPSHFYRPFDLARVDAPAFCLHDSRAVDGLHCWREFDLQELLSLSSCVPNLEHQFVNDEVGGL